MAGAQVQISVNLDAAQATSLASQLGQQLAQAAVNGNQIAVGNPAQAAATVDQAGQLNATLKQIIVSIEKINISLAKTAKLTLEANKNLDMFKTPTGKENKVFKDLMQGYDNIIKQSEETIRVMQNGVAPAVQQVQQPAEQTGKKLEQAGNKGAQAAKKTETAWDTTNKKLRGQIRTFEAIAKSFFSPITIALVAFEAAIKTVTYFWDNLTESVQKLTTRGQSAIKMAQHAQKQTEQRIKSTKDLIGQLEELNKLQTLSNDQQRLAQSIVAKINKEYKDLGITLDATTGKYVGLYQAQIKLDELNRRSTQTTLKKQIAAQRDIVNATLVNAFGRGISLDQNVKGSDFFSLAQKLGRTLGAENADMLAQKWNTGDLQKQLEVINQLIQGLSTSDKVLKNGPEAQAALQTLIDYRKQLQDLNSIDAQINDANRRLVESFKAQRDAIKATKDQIENLNKSYEDQQRANSLAGLDPEDRVNAIKGEIEALEKRNQELKKAQQFGQKQLDKTMADNFDTQINFDSLVSRLQQQSAKIKAEEEQLARKEQRVSRLLEQAKNVETTDQFGDIFTENKQGVAKQNAILAEAKKQQEKIRQLQRNLVDDQKELNALKQQFNQAQSAHQKGTTEILQHQQAIADLEKERAQNMNAIQAKEQQIAELEAQIEEAKRRQAEADQERVDNYNDYVNSLYRKEEQALNTIIGKKQQSLLLETKLNAEKILGRQLTEDELETLKKYVEIDQLLSKYKENQKVDIGRQTVITNDIARKGGYASSVVVDRSVDVNQQILSVEKNQQQLMSDIKDLMDRYSVIQ